MIGNFRFSYNNTVKLISHQALNFFDLQQHLHSEMVNEAKGNFERIT